MLVTRKVLVDMLMKYLNKTIDLSTLVDWAEEMLREADIEESHAELIRDILARIGLADVREFGLTWEACYEYLQKLGYEIKVELSEVK
jgi:cobyrinic acid a,c-diamide synthase